MSANPHHCPMSIDDMEAGNEILKAPLGYCPKIDLETRMILRALLEDMFNHLHTWHDPEKCEDAWASAQFMHDILSDILNRTPENTSVPDSLEWLKSTPTTYEEKTDMLPDENMSFQDIDDLLAPVFKIDLDSQHEQVIEHLEEELKEALEQVQRYRNQ